MLQKITISINAVHQSILKTAYLGFQKQYYTAQFLSYNSECFLTPNEHIGMISEGMLKIQLCHHQNKLHFKF